MSGMYAKAKEAFISGSLHLTSDTIKATICSATYAANLATDQYYSSVGATARLAEATLAGKSVTGGVFDATDLSFASVAAGSTITQLVIWKDSGDPATSPLICQDDTATGLPLATNGGDVAWQFSDGASKIFAM